MGGRGGSSKGGGGGGQSQIGGVQRRMDMLSSTTTQPDMDRFLQREGAIAMGTYYKDTVYRIKGTYFTVGVGQDSLGRREFKIQRVPKSDVDLYTP